MKERFSPHLSLAQAYWKGHLRPGDCAIDATCGNGHDSALLAKILLDHPESVLLGLDLQPIALEKTLALLQSFLPESHLERVLMHRCCHSHLDRIPLPFPPRLIVYNLGYLPGGDKSLTTRSDTTLQSLEMASTLLADDGALSITCYPGHPEGAEEEKNILNWAEQLPAAKWQVCHHRWLNRAASPSFLWIRNLKTVN